MDSCGEKKMAANIICRVMYMIIDNGTSRVARPGSCLVRVRVCAGRGTGRESSAGLCDVRPCGKLTQASLYSQFYFLVRVAVVTRKYSDYVLEEFCSCKKTTTNVHVHVRVDAVYNCTQAQSAEADK